MFLPYGDRGMGQCSTCVVCDPDHVPVCDQPDEAGTRGREQPTAPPSTLPEGKTRQEEHSAMRCVFSQLQLRLFLSVQHRNVFMYIVYLRVLCLLFYIAHVYRSRLPFYHKQKLAVTFNNTLYF